MFVVKTLKLRRVLAVGTLILGVGAAAELRAEFRWHPDFTAARTAALENRRPVCVIFVEDLATGDPLAGTSLDDPAADAVLDACFETVFLDRAAAPDLARKLVVSRTPMIYVFTYGVGTRLVTAFPPPETTPEFVAAAARAAQEAATLSQLGGKSRKPDGMRIHVGAADEEPHGSSVAVSDSAVSRKFRRLTEFAGDPPSFADVEWLAEEAREPLTTESPSPRTEAAADTLAVAPAEPEPRPEPAPDPLPEARRPIVQPSVPISPEAPWAAFLDPQADLRPVQPPTEQAAAAERAWTAGGGEAEPAAAAPAAFGAPDAAPVARAGSLPMTAPPESTEKKPAASMQSQFVEALQKPFTFWRRPQPEPKAVTPPAPQPKLSPAWSLSWGRKPDVAEQAAKEPSGNPSTSDGRPAARADYQNYSPMPLGMEGYCPVTLVEKGAWAEGRAQWGARHRGRTYLFAGEHEQRAFLADPDRYAPALSGDDPVLAFESGTSTPGQRRYGVTYQSRMYLFSSAETRAAFAADPDRYTGRVLMAEQSGAAESRRY